MKNQHYSLLVSNILDPLTHNEEDLQKVYQQLAETGRYGSIETRLIQGDALKQMWQTHFQDQVESTFWITGDLQRAGYNLSSLNPKHRRDAVKEVKQMMKCAEETGCTWLGIASGKREADQAEGIIAFADSVNELLDEIKQQGYHQKLIIEPLDQFAHKCNVLGNTDSVLAFLNKIKIEHRNEKRVRLCWDSAHVALNEDSFEESMQKLAPYIVRIHFANAVLDKSNPLYGDHHLPLCPEGFLNKESAADIVRLARKYLNENITFAMEIREEDPNHAWQLEEESYRFLQEVSK